MSKLIGKIIIQSVLEAKTGLRVGGTTGGLKIGGVDLNVITDPLGKPYIPGSSLKGKMRSLAESKAGVPYNDNNNRMHVCKKDADIAQCMICKIFGTTGDKDNQISTLTRFYCRDAFLIEASITSEMRRNLDLSWSEVKFETAIDRKKGTALQGSLRQVERVPAGAQFACEFIFNIFEDDDRELVKNIFSAMQLLQDDYLGGMGSRGYGKIEFSQMKLWWNRNADYESGNVELADERILNGDMDTPSKLVQEFKNIKSKLV